MKISEFNEYIKLSETKGLSVLFNHNSSVSLNKFGYYDEVIFGDNNEHVNDLLLNSYTIFNASKIDKISSNLYGQLQSIKFNYKLGYFYNLYAGFAVEDDFRANGSSGGLTSWITSELFKTNKITHLIHVIKGANGVYFEYGISKSISEVKDNSKTRYYPVELSKVLDYVLMNEGKYAIIGIPDIISSIRLLSEINPIFKERILFFIGLICGHQKSTKFLESMVKQSGLKIEEITNFDFRHKIPTNSADLYGVKIDTKTQSIIIDKRNLVGQDWGQGLFKLESSDYTDDVFNETADITLGDAWIKKFSNDSKGTNIVIVRNPIIRDLLNQGLKDGRIFLENITENEVYQSQKSHYIHTHDELGYRLYLRSKTDKWVPVKRVKSNNNYPIIRKLIQKNRILISSKSHSIYLKNVEKHINFFIKRMKVYTVAYRYLYKFVRIKKLLKKVQLKHLTIKK